MGTPEPNGKFTSHGTYGNAPTFTQINDELRTAPAFLCLRPVEQMILVDFIATYNTSSNYDRDPSKVNKPLLYTFGMCGLTCAKNTFYKSMLSLQEHGFMVASVAADATRGQATRYTTSIRWRTWTPDRAQLRVLNEYARRRTDSISDRTQLRFPFVKSLARLNMNAREKKETVSHLSQSINDALETLCNTNGSRPHPQPNINSVRSGN